MALEATFRELTTGFHRLHDVVNALHVTMEDKPEDSAAVADDLADKTLELLGSVHDARRAAVKARQSLRHPPDMDQARRLLTACQERFHRIEQKFSVNLVSYEKLKELARVGSRNKEWSAWAHGAKQGIEQVRAPLDEISTTLAKCWHELVEHGGKTSISVTTTGQRIVTRDPLVNERIRQRMT
jgi:DNA-binding ferritin-like protein